MGRSERKGRGGRGEVRRTGERGHSGELGRPPPALHREEAHRQPRKRVVYLVPRADHQGGLLTSALRSTHRPCGTDNAGEPPPAGLAGGWRSLHGAAGRKAAPPLRRGSSEGPLVGEGPSEGLEAMRTGRCCHEQGSRHPGEAQDPGVHPSGDRGRPGKLLGPLLVFGFVN